MMLKRYLAIACSCASVFAGCINDKILDEELFNTVRLNTTIEPSNGSHERANIDIFGKGEFTEGDQITVLYNTKLKDMLWNGGKWSTGLQWSDIGEQATFTGFYPIISHEFTTKILHEVQTNQQTGDNFEKSDLLYAGEVTVNKGQEVNLKFNHLMSCLTVVLKGNRYTTEQLQNAKVTLKAYNKVWMTPDNGQVGKVDGDPNNIPTITLKHKEGTTFQAVICPQQVNNLSHNEIAPWLKITVEDKSYNVVNPPANLNDGKTFSHFESGKNITLNYSFDTVDKEFQNKTCWAQGITNMPDVISSGEWKQISGSRLKHLPWKAEYGWFDCNKKDSGNPTYDDNNMCWAATASNLIHWWFSQNEKNITAFCEKTNKNIDDIPHKYTGGHDTEVFDLFKKDFTNEGGFARLGFDWYFLGKYSADNNAAAALVQGNSGGGFFKEVFGENTAMSEKIAITNYNDLNCALKKAFKENKAVGFSVLMKGFGNSGHAMTIWGAKFDEAGNVSKIYYVDNNDAVWGDKNPTGLIEARVGEYTQNDDPEKRGRACMENSQGEIAIHIQNVDLLDLKTEEWNTYLQKN